MKKSIFKKAGLLTLLLSVFSLGIVGCASEEEKAMSDEQRQEEEYFGLEDESGEQEEAQMQQQQEDEFSLEDEFAASEDIGQQQHAELQQQQTAQDKPWADQQISLNKVKDVQESLNNKGFSAGDVDGLIGPETQSALKNFQEANNLTASGELDQETIDALGLDINLKQAQEESGQSQMAE